ncbi:MAG: DNA replication/repair protein RecF [Actinomycetota bacterium]|nr:DNA replication/repair protein RecF [Actinomycetota bacterium]
MFVERLELVDFRSYVRARLDLGPGSHVVVGANAQGKTNLLEALHYVAAGASHRVSSDAPLVRSGAEAAVIRAAARTGTAHDSGRALSVELQLSASGRARARVNGQPLRRLRDAFGRVRVVLFAPEDVQLVVGTPADRRRFLDDLLAQRRPAYRTARQEYERVLRQRNALLKALRARSAATTERTLHTWTEALVGVGATMVAARLAAVQALAGSTGAAYAELAAPDPGPGRTAQAPGPRPAQQVTLAYELSTGRSVAPSGDGELPTPGELAGELHAGLTRLAAAERERGLTLAGPHRDDLYLGIGALPAKGFASHGECWSLALALRLAARELLRVDGDEPVVMLDDVFSALDVTRRARLAQHCGSFEQVLVTAAVAEDVPLAGQRHVVSRGGVLSAATRRSGGAAG